MLYVNIGNNDDRSKVFHIQNFPLQLNDIELGEVVSVTADFAELVYIKNRFDNLPFPTGFSRALAVSWFGDMARFILANL